MIDIYFFRLYNFDVDMRTAWRTAMQNTCKYRNVS